MNAIDGKEATEWSTNGDGDGAWIELHLGEPREIVAFGFRSRMMTDGTSIATSMEIVLDGTQHVGPFATPDHTRLYRFEFAQPICVLVARIEVRSSTGGEYWREGDSTAHEALIEPPLAPWRWAV